MVNSKLESVEAKSSKLRKDLIAAMDETNKENEKVKELSEALHMEKALIAQKDEEIQAALLRTDAERDKVIQKFMQFEKFSNLQFIQYFKGLELLRRWTMNHNSLVVDFSNLDFEKIDIEVLADKAKELEETSITAVVGGVDASEVGKLDSSQKDVATTPTAE